MKYIPFKVISLLAAAVIIAGCPPPPPGIEETAADMQIIEQLQSRRLAMNPMEADVKFSFPPGTFLTSSLEGHAAYLTGEDDTRLRVAAVGALGAISLDLLVEKRDFIVRLPGYTEPLCQKDLCVIYGDGTLIRTPSILARRPGLFFGGIPDGVGAGWTFEDSREGKWLIPPDEKDTRYLIQGNPAVVKKAMFYDKDIGTILVELDQLVNSTGGPLPTRISAKFEGRVLFALKVRNWTFGSPLPDSVFKMERGKHSSEL